jgi:hypothetical protein
MQDAVDHRQAKSGERVDAPTDKTVDDLLYEYVHGITWPLFGELLITSSQ